jgi:hypothetical protein
VFEDNDWKEQRAPTNREGITRMLACYDEILRTSSQTSVCDLKSYSGTLASPSVLLDSRDDPD